MWKVIIGLCSGIISGMGIGGGAILIPALTLFQGLSQQVAQGVNLVYFLPTAVVSLVVHIRNHQVDKGAVISIGLSGIVAALLGAWVATVLSGDWLRRMFGGFLLLIGIYEIVKGVKMGKE